MIVIHCSGRRALTHLSRDIHAALFDTAVLKGDGEDPVNDITRLWKVNQKEDERLRG